MKTIIVTQRNGDYHACIEGHPGKWGCGATREAAIGDLIWSHPITFELAVHINPYGYTGGVKKDQASLAGEKVGG